MNLFKKDCSFLLSVSNIKTLPYFPYKEIALLGRSNVGKSSLINALTNKKYLAYSARTPGTTKTINFFTLNNKMILVDLPGYGYMKGSHTDIQRISSLIAHYISNREKLVKVFLLLDIRHGIKQNDMYTITWLQEQGVDYQLVYTKADKVCKARVLAQKDLVTSSQNKYGITEFRRAISQCL